MLVTVVVVVVSVVIVIVRLVEVNSVVVGSIEGVDVTCFEEILDAPREKQTQNSFQLALRDQIFGVTLVGGALKKNPVDAFKFDKRRQSNITGKSVIDRYCRGGGGVRDFI